MLGDEFGTASNIKSRVNRQSVLGAITSAQQRLKLYNKVKHAITITVPFCADLMPNVAVAYLAFTAVVLLPGAFHTLDTCKNTWHERSTSCLPLLQVPPNGLVVYTGTILTDEGKEKKVNIDFEPFKPINTSLYLCDNKFHTEALNELLESDNKYNPCTLCYVQCS